VLLAVAVHEVAGHGLAAILLGGRCLGFTIDLEGMGWAYTLLPPGSPAWKHTAVLAAGVTATTGFGALCLLLAAKVRKPFISLALLMASINMLLEGTSYVFWNAVNPVPPGDIGRIIANFGNPWLRLLLIAAGGILMLGATWCSLAMLFRRLEGWLGSDGQLLGGKRIAVLGFLAAAFALTWFLFDWDQLSPGLGQIPNEVGAAAGLVAAVSLYWVRFEPRPFRPTGRTLLLSALAGYVILGTAILAIALWLHP
jgi:hypothetical protein